MIAITAKIPSRKLMSNGGKEFNCPSRVEVFVKSKDGKWSVGGEPLFEAEVIAACRWATNWQEIKAVHFAQPISKCTP